MRTALNCGENVVNANGRIAWQMSCKKLFNVDTRETIHKNKEEPSTALDGTGLLRYYHLLKIFPYICRFSASYRCTTRITVSASF